MRNITFGIFFVGAVLIAIGLGALWWLPWPDKPSKKIYIPGVIIALIGLMLMYFLE